MKLMKRVLFCGLAVTLMASFAVAASEVVTARGTRSTSGTQVQQVGGQSTGLPALSPTPDPVYPPSNQSLYAPSSPSNQSLYTPSNPSVYTPSGQSPNPLSTPTLTPQPQYPVITQPGYSVVGQPMELFRDVRYRGQRNVAPDAVPTILQVADPCNRDRCCKTCVNVEVCAPPCDPKCVRVTRDGNKVRYDFGRYEIVIKSVGDHLVVHYGD
jgi:hypothetical protein